MPLFLDKKEDKIHYAIWKISEQLSFFKRATHLPEKHKIPVKEIEHQASRFLLKKINPNFPFEKVWRTGRGKPRIQDDDFFFTLSHSYPYVAVAISPDPVGIDIQVFEEKIIGLENKFLSPEEQRLFNHKTEEVTMAWSAKEAVFKWSEQSGIDFKEHMPIMAFALEKKRAHMEIEFRRSYPFRKVQLIGGRQKDFCWMVTRGVQSNQF